LTWARRTLIEIEKPGLEKYIEELKTQDPINHELIKDFKER
jgi:hypothetical protein